MILGIESSCDESAMALFSPGRGLVGEWLASQVAIHQVYGGIVPDLASREHLRNFPALCECVKADVGWGAISRIAVTTGPGLAGCLALGVSLAKSLCLALRVPLVGVNHLRGHAFSPFIDLHREDPIAFKERLAGFLPHLGLLVSGGNTLLFVIDNCGTIHTIASTVDDAAGEALDKGAKLLGLPYPGGPLIEKRAEAGNPAAYDFPRAFPRAADLKFSFSGLKTSLRYMLEKMDDAEVEQRLSDLCASYQRAVVDSLVSKTRQALDAGSYRSIGLSGGVSNNTRLRRAFEELSSDTGQRLFLARREHTGDNAAMIAFAAWADPHAALAERDDDLTIHPTRELTTV